MTFLSNVKYQYNKKILQDFFVSNHHKELLKHLLTLNQKNKDIFYSLSKEFVAQSILLSDTEITNAKIIWLNSYLDQDLDYISSFIEFYMSNKYQQNAKVLKYENLIVETVESLLKEKSISFNDSISYSYLYQWLILNNSKAPYIFIRNNLPFFSTENNLNFTNSKLTRSYLFLIDHPYKIYSKLKKEYDNDAEVARNVFLNLDNKSFFSQINQTNYEMNIKGWHTNTESWTNINVINSLRGQILLKKHISNNPYDSLSSIIFHLIQSGVEIEMDYNLIQDFVEKNECKLSFDTPNLSSKEIKFLSPYVEKYIDEQNL